jgi:hypothetical protein
MRTSIAVATSISVISSLTAGNVILVFVPSRFIKVITKLLSAIDFTSFPKDAVRNLDILFRGLIVGLHD